jgi:hypothetical protein
MSGAFYSFERETADIADSFLLTLSVGIPFCAHRSPRSSASSLASDTCPHMYLKADRLCVCVLRARVCIYEYMRGSSYVCEWSRFVGD